MTNHPEWVWKRAADVLNEEVGGLGYEPDDRGIAICAVASLIAKYEQEPVDPDVEVVRRVILAWYGVKMEIENHPDFSSALAAYKALMASRT
jgi:hypothetical protein